MKKMWFQHDFNCHEKTSFLGFLKMAGPLGYGRFWLFAEQWYLMQQHSSTYIETQMIPAYKLMQLWHCNRKTFEKVLETFSKGLGLEFETFSTPTGNVLKTRWPKSLNYIDRRFQKTGYLEGELERERELECFTLLNFLNSKTGSSFKTDPETTKIINSGVFEKGFSISDAQTVIIHLTDLWADDPKMKNFLRPSTIFGRKFSEYLTVAKTEGGDNDIRGSIRRSLERNKPGASSKIQRK